MLQVVNLRKSYGNRLLFKDVTFSLDAGEHMGLVGRNGSGKTTLFRLIMGEETPDEGTITTPRDYRIGAVSQKLVFTAPTAMKEASKCVSGPEHEWYARKVLYGLGFTEEDVQKHPQELSGGFQVRLNLSKVLISQPDLLLLDEPTNYLDIVSLRWLERFLIKWRGEFILITHDRSFMNRVTNTTMGIHRLSTRKVRGSTEKLYNQLAEEEEVYEKTRLNEEKKRRDVEVFISRFRAKARLANLVQSRIKMLEKQEQKEKLSKIKTLDFSFNEAPIAGDLLMQVKNLKFSYPESQPLIEDLSINVNTRDRIGIIGKNGKGKTTLLKLLSGELEPLSGRIKTHPECRQGVFVQTNRARFNDMNTVEEEILSVHPEHDRQHSRNICGAMLFEGDEALKKINVLSGGEKSRVLLGKVLVEPANLLILDEPTNHFDMETNDALLQALDNFEGAVLLVTHNEMFLHALANRLIVFQDDGVSVFEGTYQQFLEKKGWEEEAEEKTNSNSGSLNKKDLRRIRSEIISRKSSKLRPLEKKMAELETSIANLETEEQEQQQELVHASEKGEGQKISYHAQRVHEIKEKLEKLYHELGHMMEEAEKIEHAFAQELEPYTE